MELSLCTLPLWSGYHRELGFLWVISTADSQGVSALMELEKTSHLNHRRLFQFSTLHVTGASEHCRHSIAITLFDPHIEQSLQSLNSQVTPGYTTKNSKALH